MENNQERKDIQQEMPSPHEIMDCKRVFTRRNIPEPNIENEWNKLNLRMNRSSKKHLSFNINTFYIFGGGMVASVLLIFGIYWLINKPTSIYNTEYVAFKSNIDSKEITLSSGNGDNYELTKKINPILSNSGIQASCDSLCISKETNIQEKKELTLTTPRGKDYYLVLSDGTKVWLNADSKLTFPKRFSNEKRIVKLEGEAYFEVAHDATHPFIVENSSFVTQVLGTKFNIKAYSSNNANIVLLEGKVTVENKYGTAKKTISPGQMALLSPEGNFSIKETDTYAAIQWKEGFFYFNNVPLTEVMQELGRWYNMDILFENSRYKNTCLHFTADRRDDINAALKNLNMLEIVHATIENNKIIIK